MLLLKKHDNLSAIIDFSILKKAHLLELKIFPDILIQKLRNSISVLQSDEPTVQ